MLACVNKVTEMNCSFFFLFKLGFSFVKKRTGKRTCRTKVLRYIHWLPRGMMDLGMAEQGLSSGSLCSFLPCTLQQYRCGGMPTFATPPAFSTSSLCAGHISAQGSCSAGAGENKLPLPCVQVGLLSIAHRRTGAALCWANSFPSVRPWTSLGL